MTLRWPVFSAQLVEQTPFRSVVSLPLLDHGPVGALDLYLTSSSRRLPPVDVLTADIAEPIAATSSVPAHGGEQGVRSRYG